MSKKWIYFVTFQQSFLADRPKTTTVLQQNTSCKKCWTKQILVAEDFTEQ